MSSPTPEPATIVLAAQAPTAPRQPTALTPGELADVIADPETEADARDRATRQLLNLEDQGIQALSPLLARPQVLELILPIALESPGTATTVLLALPGEGPSEDQIAELIEQCSKSRSKRAVRAIMGLLDRSPRLVEAASHALARQTGMSDKTSPAGWRTWWEAHQSVEPDAWAQTLLAEQIDRAQTLERRVTRLDRLVLDAYRRLYLLTAPEGRSALLGELLDSDQQALRDLGFELADRELSANATLDGSIATKAIGLLGDPSPSTRASAARLVNRLSPPEAAAPIAQALERETSPVAAEALLAAAARWPSPGVIEPVLHWMKNPTTAASACAAGLALVDRGQLMGDEHRVRARESLVPLSDDPAPACIQLLNVVGTDPDRQSIVALLSSEKPRVRQAAADALARLDVSAPLLVQRAAQDPAVAPLALVALATHGRLSLATQNSPELSAWDEAYAAATSGRVKAALASAMLETAGDQLTDERRTELEGAVSAGGG